jgi:archaetidylinositol phosphate synthase
VTGIENHTRINDILLGPLERPALNWLAVHMPAWVTPDMLTGVGILGTLLIALGYLLSRLSTGFLWLSSLGFIINWFGDSMDGSLARFRHIERPKYGFYIDHVVDAFSEAIIILSLGISPFVRFNLASLALIGYFLLGTIVFIRTYVIGEFRISYGKLGPTEARLFIIIANTLAIFTHNPGITLPVLGFLTLFDGIVVVLTVLLYYFSITTAVQGTIELARRGE